MAETPEVLEGGGTTDVVRVDERVIRSRRQGSERVEFLLRLLEERGFSRAPRFLGLTSDGQQILTYIDGTAGTCPLTAQMRSDEVLVSAAHTLRGLHDATQDIAAGLVGGWMLPDVEPYEVICHGDFAPYNCVFRDRTLAAVIDFDTAHPGPRLRDVAYAVYRYAPITAPDSSVGFGSVAEQARRARLFCDAYGRDVLGDTERGDLVGATCDRLVELVAFMRAAADQGDESFRSHLRDGHDTAYLRDVEHLRRNGAEFTAELLHPRTVVPLT
jgi:hypothetical protein